MHTAFRAPAREDYRQAEEHRTCPSDQTPLALVIPCHNESEAVAGLDVALRSLRRSMRDRYCLELLFVDDGSTDDTESQLHEHFASWEDVTIIRHISNQGIAAAIATGLRHANAEIVASIDADCTYDPLELVRMVPLLTEGVDMVLASPYHPQGQVAGVPAWRLGLSRLASRLYRRVFRNQLYTYTSCVRVYRRSAVVDLPLRNGDFVGVVELAWQLDRRGGTLVEHPAVLKTRAVGSSKMRVVRTTLAHLRLLTRALILTFFPRWDMTS